MTLHGIDLLAIAAMMIGAFAVCYALLLWKLRALIAARQLKIADEIGKLDDAIRTLETRLAERQQQVAAEVQKTVAESSVPAMNTEHADDAEGTEDIAPEIQAAIAAATVTVLGQNAILESVKTVPSPWTQQGRVLVQGGHNLRVRR